MTAEEIDNRPNYGLPTSESLAPRIRTNAEMGFPEYAVRKKKKKKPKYDKPASIKKLEADYHEWKYRGRGIPTEAQVHTKFRDDSSNGVTVCILAFMHVLGHYAVRVNVQGTWNQHLQRYIISGATKGVSDTNMIIRGLAINVEVKYGKDKLRPDQIKRRDEILASGGIYFTTGRFDDFLDKIKIYL